MRSYKTKLVTIGVIYHSIFLNIALFISSYASADSSTTENNPPPSIHNYPTFQLLRPNWGVELYSCLNSFGAHALVPSQGSNPAYAFGALFEYQPAFIQSIGVLGIGPSFTIYPILSGSSTSSFFSLFSVGGQIRYQARFIRQQFIVPVIAYHLEYLSYQFTVEGNGLAKIQGPALGLWILLNSIEPSASNQMYIDSGILRTYAIIEWRNMSGSDNTITIESGSSYYFGLRFEF